MPKFSRDKGKRGERQACEFLKSLGFSDARRSAQATGKTGMPDVECPRTFPEAHFEVKVGANLQPWNMDRAMDQAMDDCLEGRVPIVLWKRDRCQWVINAWWHGVYVHVTGPQNCYDFLHLIKMGIKKPAPPEAKQEF